MTVFDRSWYGRVLVERVESLIEPTQWERAYDEINAFERSLVHDGTIIVKFLLISLMKNNSNVSTLVKQIH